MPATAGGSTSGSSTSVTTAALPAEVARGQQVGGGRPHEHDQRQRGRSGLQAQQQRVAGLGLPQAGDQLARARVEEDRRHGQPEEDQYQGQRDAPAAPGTRRQRASGRRRPDACLASAPSCPGPSRRLWTKALAACRLLRALHHRDAIGHRAARARRAARSPSACPRRRRRRCGTRSRRRPRPGRPSPPRPSRRAPRSGRWPRSLSAPRPAGRTSTLRVYSPTGTDSEPTAILMPGLREVLERARPRRPRRAPPAPARWWRRPPASRPGPPVPARRAAWCWPRRRRRASLPCGSGRRARRSRRTRSAGRRRCSPASGPRRPPSARRRPRPSGRAWPRPIASSSPPQPATRQQRRSARAARRLTRGPPSPMSPSPWRRRARPRPGPSSSTASRVTAAVTRCGPASISTSAITPSDSTDRTTPGKRLRAESESPAAWREGCPARRSTSSAGTRRRLAESRSVRSLPARSQRRRVSALTPIARAASPSDRSPPAICLSIA